MTDIFDTKILCSKCNVQMQKTIIEKEGMELRAVKCPHCGDRIIHPADINSSEHFNNLRGKTFHVKLRMVGNSHAISIPKEIVDFVNEQHRQHKQVRREMDDMVRLCFEDFRKLSVMFGEEDDDEEDLEDEEDIERPIDDNLFIKRVKMKKIDKNGEYRR